MFVNESLPTSFGSLYPNWIFSSFVVPALILGALFSFFVIIQWAIELWLARRQVRYVLKHVNEVPAAFSKRITLRAHQRAAAYTTSSLRAGTWEKSFAVIVLFGWTLFGGLNALNTSLIDWIGHGFIQQVALLLSFAAITMLLNLPWSLYKTLIIEERHGFNRITWRLWMLDALRGLLVLLVIAVPLAAAVIWLMQEAGNLWWLWVWILWSAFNILMLWLYPVVIAPLFNQFKPLEDETLKNKIFSLLQQTGFQAKGLFVMDGSKRSAHANAFFTGFGNAKRVVFFDTLLNKLNADQIQAVMAHELGHFKGRHIVKRLGMFVLLSFIGFALLDWLIQEHWFYMGLGVSPEFDNIAQNLSEKNSALGLLLFMFLVSVFSDFIRPLITYISRRHEFEADAYAAQHTNAQDLADALLKLYEDNAATLTPDPLYAAFHYSHPPALQRIQRLHNNSDQQFV